MDGSFKLWGLQLSSEYKEAHITSMFKVMCKIMNLFSLTQYIVTSAAFPSASNKCAMIDNSPYNPSLCSLIKFRKTKSNLSLRKS